ncbi:MAG: hypothetical protein SPL61_10420 [Saccharofermentans sp.]|nr:hypothetical protein [Saccharofermentans sp.]
MDSKLLNVRCDNCGAEYRISSRGEMVCRFCGSNVYLSDMDFKAYKNTRDNMLMSDRFTNDEAADTGDVLRLWNNGSTANFKTIKGVNISFDCYYSVILDDKEVYIGADKIAVIFSNTFSLTNFTVNLSQIEYPSADIKDLSRFLPNIIFKSALEDGRSIIIISKTDNIYPLFLFENLKATTVAWIISRLENLGCLLEFNNMDFRALRAEDIYINPKTHELFILDGWDGVEKTSRRNYLKDMRLIAKDIMDTSTAPELCMKFLDSDPEETAYDDFSAWDEVIMKGFNGHNFHQFNT